MASVGDAYPYLHPDSDDRGSSLRAHSYSAVESHLSPSPSPLSSSFSSTSSTSTVGSTSSTSTLTEPVSPTNGGVPLWKTLVRPRPWRFVQRSRVGGSLDRERAREEDTTLDDEVKNTKPEPSVEDDVFKSKEKNVRTKSESDIAVQKRQVGFKTRAERFSLHDNGDSKPQYSTISRSQTLPPSARISLSPKSRTLPLESSLRRSRSNNRTPDGPKTVKFSEPERVELSPARSCHSSGSLDSPSRSINLNVQDSTVRVSFSKAAATSPTVELDTPVGTPVPVSEKSPVTSGANKSKTDKSLDSPVTFSTLPGHPTPVTYIKPDIALTTPATNKSSPDKPDVPSKPARLSYTSNGSTKSPDSGPGYRLVNGPSNEPTSVANPVTVSLTKQSVCDSKSVTQQSPVVLKSPSIPEEKLLFTVGYTASDTHPQICLPATNTQPSHPNKPTLTECDSHPLETVQNENDSKTLRALSEHEHDMSVSDSEILSTNNNLSKPSLEASRDSLLTDSVTDATEDDVPEPNKKSSKLKDKEIVPKKMIKIKGDKKAEEKAAKAKKKEQKAKEKEMKSKKKSEGSDHEKGRVKLFPWRVEFSVKDKAVDTSTGGHKVKDGKRSKKEGKRGREGKEDTPVDPPPARPDTDTLDGLAAPKKAVKKDGTAKISSNKKSRDKKSPPPPPPLLHPPEQQQQQQQLHQQQQQQPHPQREQEDDINNKTPSPSTPTRLTPSPSLQQQYQQQQQQQHQLHQQPPRQRTPQPRYFDDVSSSDYNSDLDSWYGSLPRRLPSRAVRICQSDGEGPPGPSGQGGRRVVPRRHTVGGAQIRDHMQLVEDTDRKREAFYEMLASRYPQYANKITGLSDYPQPGPATQRNSRSREPQRRRTTVGSLPGYSSRHLDYEDPGTMSDIELSSFQRGGYGRASMPIVRSASTSLERPIGLVFLVYRDETKKALLPNEITSLDTVRALFVRAFPDKLSLDLLESPKHKIYILETATSIFFQLEDLGDIQDRTVLKIHECDSVEPQQVKCQIESRGRATQPARPATRQGFVGESGPDLLHKERLPWETEHDYFHQRHSRSRSLTPDSTDRHRSLSSGPPRGRYSHSPDGLPMSERGPPHLNPIPENPRLLANGFRQTASGGNYEHGPHSHSQHPTGFPHSAPGRGVSGPVGVGYEGGSQGAGYPVPQAYVTHSTRAPFPQGPQRATTPDMRGATRGGPPQRPSLAFDATSNPMYECLPQRAQSYRLTPERDAPPPRPHSAIPRDMSRMERMEAQIANLTAWVHKVQVPPTDPQPTRRCSSRSTSSAMSEGTDTYPGSSASSLSDIPAAYSVQQPVISPGVREQMNDLQCRMRELRVELQGLRRMEQLNQEAMRDAFTDTMAKIKKVISSVPGADDQVVRQQRVEVNSLVEAYRQDREKVDRELSDLEVSVEDLKNDVIGRQCRVNVAHIEGLALVLSNITKALANLKARFPEVSENLRKVMAGEMEVVVKEERFLKEESQHIEAALKRCKKITSTLYTLKRLATVQDGRPPQVPSLATETREVGDQDKMAVLDSIRCMVPDHEARVQSMEAADASRERKKKIVTQHESLKFTKCLQNASKGLKSSDTRTGDQGMGDKEACLANTRGDTGSAKSQGFTDTRKDKDCMKPQGFTDTRRSEPPAIPAKPARLLSSEGKRPEHTSQPMSNDRKLSDNRIVASQLVSNENQRHENVIVTSRPEMHTVTVTSQMCHGNERDDVDARRSSARSVFFSSLDPLSSPAESSDLNPSLTTIPSNCGTKPVSGMTSKPVTSPSPSSSQQSTPTPSDSEDSGVSDKGKKVPPPPPPRTSSAKYPYGIGPLSPQSPSDTAGGGFFRRQNSGDKSPDRKQGATLTVYKGHSPQYATSKPLSSSTPKPPTPLKPQLSKARRDAGRGQLQGVTSFTPPVPAAVTTNSQDPLGEGELSDNESTGSTTSLDSQQGAGLLRSNSALAHRLSKPHPPHRQSSLLAKQSPPRDSQPTNHVNGLDAVHNGHTT